MIAQSKTKLTLHFLRNKCLSKIQNGRNFASDTIEGLKFSISLIRLDKLVMKLILLTQ